MRSERYFKWGVQHIATTSEAWPYIRAIGRAMTIPGANIGRAFLADIQDQLSTEEAAKDVSIFAFIQQTFQEYMAAWHLGESSRSPIEDVMKEALDPGAMR